MPNNDYILRGDALKAILGVSIYDTIEELEGARTIAESTWADGLYDAYKIIEEEVDATDVEPKRRWIPTTEDVPHIKEGCVGVVVVNAVYWAIGKYISMPLRYVRKKIRNKLVERWEYMDGSIIHKSVLYWMPLPEPPKEADV